MAANVETMFYVREKPWHGLGTCVEEAPTSADALRLAGLDWEVKQRNIQVCGGAKIENFKANVRSSDGAVLGVVHDPSVRAQIQGADPGGQRGPAMRGAGCVQRERVPAAAKWRHHPLYHGDMGLGERH